MRQDYKIIQIPELVVAQIRSDVNNNEIRVYAMDRVPDIFIHKDLIHPDVALKSTCVVAGVSGSNDAGINYMFLAAARIDQVSGSLVTDLDPIVMVSDLSTNTARPSGVTKFHGDFIGRTEFLTSGISTNISDLQRQITGSVLQFDDAPRRFKEAMHFMAKQYHQKIL